MKKLPLVRQFSTSFDPTKRNPNSIPIPHRTIPEPCGQDHDFITIAHSHLIHSEWPNLNSLAPKLTPFRSNHILLKIQKDPVLSLDFYNFSVSQNPNSQSLDTHSIILHILTKFKRFKSAESILRKILIPQTLNSSSELFDAILHSYRLCDSSPNVFDSLFKTYAHIKKFRKATETFCRMRDYGFLPTIRSCNAFVSSLLDLGRNDIALAFYKEMGRCRISPNVYTLNMVMCAFCNSGKLEKALEVFEKMEMMGFSPMDSSFNTLIAAYCKNGLIGAALKLKNEMYTKGLIPNVITYNSLIHGFCKEGKLNEANKVFNEMKTVEVKPNTVTYNSLIRGYAQINNGEMGLRIYEDMLMNRVEVDIVTYNALILGLCNEGKTRKAAFLVKELDKANLAPNSSTFSALISGQCKRQNSERAFQIFKAMKKNGCHPNYDTFKILLLSFYHNKDYEGSLEVLREMLERWMAPDKTLLTDLYEGLGRLGKSHLLTELFSAANAVRLIPKDFVDRGSNSQFGIAN
ncbi:uncharacterized protein A4U43_C03F26380 [Asparagus officinalis]|uniref:Pentacotripeptide-repeat region of PRORP domain-containing protein n=1 Tax=Asparagus officinalis TaxID=4686 RepID=A0A5P1FDY4_ASPOF|nr:pentatricopeptide repeat-containing protein At4g26680, mitochondrial [Asparagus officinalis]ONK76322.1 uncharacterized protein A4U43_C03F26380 [Asparagus officinalis]